MASEVIKLNLIPKGEMPVFHASQFDTGRLITCELYRGEDAYSVPEGYTVELHCRKVDNNIVTMESTLINDNVVTFTSTEQLTACNGNNLCEVAILDEGYRIGTLNFILEVEVDPLKGGITSTSEIHNLETQIEEITTEIIGENYYDKSEVDDLLDAKADADSVYTIGEVNTLLSGKANAADVYTKSQTDTLLSAKANSSDVYTKTQVDSALAFKANAADVYTKAQVDSALALKANAADVYTKAQVDNIILNIMPVDTASGATAEFTTKIAASLVSVIADITATGGGGTPVSPVPVVGYSQAIITVNGDDITVSFGRTVFGGKHDVLNGRIHITWGSVDLGSLDWTYRTSGTALAPYFYTNFTDIKSAGPAYSTVQPILTSIYTTVKRDQTVFVDDTICGDGSATAITQIQVKDSRYTDADAFKTAMNGIIMVYELVTPVDIDVTAESISAVAGDNTLSSDTGNIEVKYKTTIQDYLDNHTGG